MNTKGLIIGFLFCKILLPLTYGQLLTSRTDGIEIIVEYGFLTGPSTPAEGVLDGNLYLKNCSNEVRSVVTGSILGPRYSSGLISYSATISSGAANIPIKPSPGMLDVVTLKPGEMTKLQHFRCSTQKANNQVVIVSYHVSDDLRKFYPDVWANDLSVQISTKAEPKGQAAEIDVPPSKPSQK